MKKALQWSIDLRIPQTPVPRCPHRTWVTTGQIPPSCSRTKLPPRHQALQQGTSTTHSHLLVDPQPPWLPLEGCRPPSLVLCPTPSLALFQVSFISDYPWNSGDCIILISSTLSLYVDSIFFRFWMHLFWQPLTIFASILPSYSVFNTDFKRI